MKNLYIILVISLLLPLTVLANNNFLDFGTDQGAHLQEGLEIAETGGWKEGVEIGYYGAFPVLAILLASIRIVTDFNANVYVFLLPTMSVLFSLALYLLTKMITKSEKVASLAPLLILSIPQLSFLWMIPKDISLILGFFCLCLAVKLAHSMSRATIASLVPLLVIMVISHVSGPAFILILLIPLVVSSVIPHHSCKIPRQFRFVSILIIMMMVTYWVFNYFVALSVMGPARDFFVIISKYLSGSKLIVEEAARPYLVISSQVTPTWFAWAVPPAIVAGYFLNRIHEKVLGKNHRDSGHWTHKMMLLGCVSGLLLLLFSFLLVQYGTYSYLIIPTYALLGFLMILFLSRLLSPKNEYVMALTVFILAVALFTGNSSPNWAPIENPDFPARRRLYNRVLYTEGFGQNLPQNASLLLDFDVYPDIPEGVRIERPPSYRISREILLLFESGVSLNELADDDSLILIVRAERVVLNGGDEFNLVRSSGEHSMITPVHYLFD